MYNLTDKDDDFGFLNVNCPFNEHRDLTCGPGLVHTWSWSGSHAGLSCGLCALKIHQYKHEALCLRCVFNTL